MDVDRHNFTKIYDLIVDKGLVEKVRHTCFSAMLLASIWSSQDYVLITMTRRDMRITCSIGTIRYFETDSDAKRCPKVQHYPSWFDLLPQD